MEYGTVYLYYYCYYYYYYYYYYCYCYCYCHFTDIIQDKVKDRVPSKELRERLGIGDIILILQQNRLQWYGHVL